MRPHTPATLLIALASLLLSACATTPVETSAKSLAERRDCTEPSSRVQQVMALTTQHAPLSGTYLLDTGREAFFARAALIEAAVCSIDAQYYIWNSDATGIYLAARLLAAAERGVQVRLILDDFSVGGRDNIIATLATHENVEIQIYNPFAQRRGLARYFNFMFEFQRLNRRSHIKSLTIDRAATVIGGRNIGDEYFDSNQELNFRDRDVVAIGPVLADVAAMFDAYWLSPITRPIAELVKNSPSLDPSDIAARSEVAGRSITEIHGAPPVTLEQVEATLGPALQTLTWAPAQLVFDPPPGEVQLADTDLVQNSALALHALAEEVQSEILIESAYLAVDEDTRENLAALTGRGISIRALTNSLASNDVTANHASYARTRALLLRAGVQLYELRPDAASCASLVQNARACVPPHVMGLHAKTFVMDRQLVYVGSFNMNLRSRYLNSESGLIIRSPTLAQRVANDIESNMSSDNSWWVALDAKGRPRWYEDAANAGAEPDYSREPQVTWWRRTRAAAIAMLPLEKYF